MVRAFGIALLLTCFAFGQSENKLGDNSKIFGQPPPAKKDKNLMRTVNGVVKDADGNAVGGALVYLKEVESGKERSIVAGPNGTYRFEDLYKSRDYQLRAAKGKLVSPSRTLSTFDTRYMPSMNLTVEAPPPATDSAKK